MAWREALFEIRQQVGRKLGEDGPDLLEAGVFLERCFIHVETAIDLDLQRVLAAMGCTIGQGLSGISTLSATSYVALAAILLGAVAGLKYQIWRLERTL